MLQTGKQVFITKHLKNALIVLQFEGNFGDKRHEFLAIYRIMPLDLYRHLAFKWRIFHVSCRA